MGLTIVRADLLVNAFPRSLHTEGFSPVFFSQMHYKVALLMAVFPHSHYTHFFTLRIFWWLPMVEQPQILYFLQDPSSYRNVNLLMATGFFSNEGEQGEGLRDDCCSARWNLQDGIPFLSYEILLFLLTAHRFIRLINLPVISAASQSSHCGILSSFLVVHIWSKTINRKSKCH